VLLYGIKYSLFKGFLFFRGVIMSREELIKEHFKPEEFACKCGCGAGLKDMNMDFIFKLLTARKVAGIPFILTSAFRCKQHNRNVGGVSTSSHCHGLAVDIAAVSGFHRYHIIAGLMVAGFTRIGINEDKGFVHVDADESKPQETIFLYPRSK
jgi:hypothetical protein